ncbi:MAG: HD domain-containing protein [Acidobacteria bacterium]|nr:HD domain-containing protein [Acidobacteriota bacterium]
MAQSPDSSRTLEERVNSFVEWLFEGHQTIIPRDAKIINDALLGNQYFAKHEVAVIDTPLLQRLKRIKQTGLVYQVFPSATHSRFEHSLGAVTLAERCFNAIQDRTSVEYPRKRFADADRIKGDLAHLRMAAMLHDVGHGFLSHASEQIYKILNDLQEFRKKPKYTKNEPGEILSYLIVKSPTFKQWFETHVREKCQADLNLDLIAEMMLGKHDDPDKHFLAQIISSPYDADKLDYIARDSFYCGLALTVDLSRFFSMISTAEKDGFRILVLRNYIPLEQILFSKMILYGSVYHHQKVKALDSMLRSIVQHIFENANQCAITVRDGFRLSFANPTQYLYITDDEFFNELRRCGDDYVKTMVDRFTRRDLFVRCLEVSRRTVSNWDEYHRKKLIDLSERPDELNTVEKEIHRRLPAQIQDHPNLGDVRLSVPSIPRLKNDFAYVQTSPQSERENIEGFFPLEQWTDSYTYNKWKCFVYSPRESALSVRDAAIDVLQERLGIQINRNKSNESCHLN